MTVRQLFDDKFTRDPAPAHSRRETWGSRRRALAGQPQLDPRRSRPWSAEPSIERPAQRLRRILTSSPSARHFSVRRIIAALGDTHEGRAAALFSAAGAFESPEIGYLSGIVTGAVGAQLVLHRRAIPLPRAVLQCKIPRDTLASVIRAVGNLLDSAEAVVRPRWDWVFHPAMKTALGVLLFLLGVVSMAPFLGFGVGHSASAFVMSVGLAERDGLAVMIGALAAIASLAVAAMSIIPGKRIWNTARNWLAACFKRLRLDVAAWMLDQVQYNLGALLRLRWSKLLYLFATDVAGALESAVVTKRSLRRRVERVRQAERQKAKEARRTRDGA